ncbi:extensin-like protein [Aliiruegeria haliotis]|uniref:Extensin-like protein n=1 Tax=Aliiruegeria haliotis TaxID=1280846 RepID=A0A2T0RR39_9RHOB|nr:extensin family protein [Aliiruegeria haliotis]PRY23659.1 extensin-like protein [Aliiruegeria haliotis]
MIRTLSMLVAAGFTAGVAAAEAPNTSLRPVARSAPEPAVPAAAPAEVAVLAAATMATLTPTAPGAEGQDDTALPPVRFDAGIRPRPRSGVFLQKEIGADDAGYGMVEVTRQVVRVGFNPEFRPSARPPHPLAKEMVLLAAASSRAATPDSPHPKVRPAGFEKLFKRRSRNSYGSAGSVCGVNAIKGTAIKPVGRPGSGCGIASPVRVTEIAGVRLSMPSTMDCTTAKATYSWIEKGMKPAVGKRGGGVAQIKVAAHYACRTRNNRPGGKLSEHAKGHAIDISGFVLKDGSQISVLKGWRTRKDGKILKRMHKAACGPYGTVLGPNADRYHQDHFHFDTARYRSGAYCK